MLSRAREPRTEFRIKQHQQAHKVVYQTARADLLDLVERGFLCQEIRGKAFVLVPCPALREKVEARSQASLE